VNPEQSNPLGDVPPLLYGEPSRDFAIVIIFLLLKASLGVDTPNTKVSAIVQLAITLNINKKPPCLRECTD